MNILKYNFKNPIDPYSEKSYLYMIKNVEFIKQQGIFDIMKPFIFACFEILGTVMVIGNRNEDMMRKVFKTIDIDQFFKDSIIKEDLQNFIINKIKYNRLKEATRKSICKLIYGIDNCVDEDFK